MFSLSGFVAHMSLQVQQTFIKCQALWKKTNTTARSLTEKNTKNKFKESPGPRQLPVRVRRRKGLESLMPGGAAGRRGGLGLDRGTEARLFTAASRELGWKTARLGKA